MNKIFSRGLLTLIAFTSVLETALAQPDDLTKWKAMAEGGAQSEIVWYFTPEPGRQHTNALRLTILKTGERFGIVCADMGKTKLQGGQWHDLSFSARTDSVKTFALTVSLESPDGRKVFARTTLPEVGGTNWMHYNVALNVHQPASKYRMVIALADTGTLWLKDFSLALRQLERKNSKR